MRITRRPPPQAKQARRFAPTPAEPAAPALRRSKLGRPSRAYAPRPAPSSDSRRLRKRPAAPTPPALPESRVAAAFLTGDPKRRWLLVRAELSGSTNERGLLCSFPGKLWLAPPQTIAKLHPACSG